MTNYRECYGLKVAVSNEAYNEYKASLREEFELLRQENEELKNKLMKYETEELQKYADACNEYAIAKLQKGYTEPLERNDE